MRVRPSPALLYKVNQMKVWLDDERKMPIDFDIRCRTASEAIELLKTGKVTEISLDNDLGQSNYQPPYEGKHVAKWIEEHAFNGTLSPMKVWIHTANPVAKAEMQCAIRNAYKFWQEKM